MKQQHSAIKWIMLLSMMIVGAGKGFAAMGTWTGTAGATWDTTAANWSDVSGTPWDSGNGPVNTALFTSSPTPSVSGTVYAGGFYVGSGSGIPTTLVITSGTLNLGGGSEWVGIGGNRKNNIGTVASSCTFTINGGNVNILAGTEAWFFNPYGGIASILNLNGGTLSTAVVLTDGAGSGSVVNFNGGTYTFTSATTLPFNGTLYLGVEAGGAIFDTGGYDVTIGPGTKSYPLLHSGSGTDGGLTKNGSGTLTLTAANTYNGNTTVNGGTLVIQQANLAAADSTVTVANGAVLSLGFSGAMKVAALVLNGVSQPSGFYNATSSPEYLAGTGSLVVGAFDVVWSGASSSEWSTNTMTSPKNWTLFGGQADYLAGMPVLFDDTLTGSSTVDISVANVTPVSVTFNNNTTNYTVQGSKAIDGATGLTKTGTGTVTLLNANTYSGATLVSGGKLAISPTGALSSAGNVNTVGDGVLDISGTLTMAANTYFAVGNGIAGTTGTTILNSGANVNLGGNAVLIGGTRPGGGGAGIGTLTINGGTLTVAAASGPTSGGADAAMIWLNPYGAAGASTLNLNGGVLSTARAICIGSAGSSVVNLNGGTLQAAASMTLNVDTVTRWNVRNGGAVIDSQGYNVSISSTLAHSNIGGDNAIDGGLTKSGSGTLTLAAANSYTGNTTVNAGTLVIQQATLASMSTVTVTNGAILSLGFSTTNTVAALVLNGVSQRVGIYNATTSPSYLAGTGSLRVSGFVAVLDLDFQGGPNTGITVPGVTMAGFTAFNIHNIAAVPDGAPSVNPSITVGAVTFAITGSVGGLGPYNGSGNDDLERDCMFLGAFLGYSESITWTLSGLAPNREHTLTWYASIVAISTRSAAITVTGGAAGNVYNTGPDLVLTATSSAAGVITGTATRNGSDAEANLCGLSVAAGPPPPRGMLVIFR